MSLRGPSKVALVYGRPLGIGGVESHVLSLLAHGDATKFRGLVLSAAPGPFDDRARGLGGEVVPWRARAAWDVIALLRLVRLLKARRADIVHAHSLRAALLGGFAASVLGIPLIVTVHSPASQPMGGPGVARRARHWAYGRMEGLLHRAVAKRVIYVSSRAFEEAVGQGLADARRMSVIENGVDLAPALDPRARSALRAALSSPPDAIVVTCVARLDPQKGIHSLLGAVHHLSPDVGNLRVWLVGDGPDRGRLESEAGRLGLRCVQFLGLRRDVPSILAASDVFALPSRYEGSSVALLEAMAAGVASVVTDVGDNSRLLREGSAGRVVPRDDAKALASALRELIGDAELRTRLGSAARAAAQDYSAARMVERTQEVYSSVGREPSG